MSRTIVEYPKPLSSMSHLRNGFIEEDSDDELFDCCNYLRTRLDLIKIHFNRIMKSLVLFKRNEFIKLELRVFSFLLYILTNILNTCLKNY